MEIDEGPTHPTDFVEETSPAHSTSADLIKTPAEIMGTPPHSGEPAPIGTSSPIAVSGDGGFDPNERSPINNLQDVEADSDEAEERFSLAEEVLEPREIDATPAVTSSPPAVKPDVEEGAGVADYTAPTPEGCVTPMGLLSAAGSPSRPRTSPKRKQLSSPEGSEIAAGWVNTVKRHSGSVPEHASNFRFPGRMPYGASSPARKVEPGTVEEGRDKVPMQQKEEDPTTPPMTPGKHGQATKVKSR